MVIEYRITRIDLVKAYIYNLRHSARTRLIVVGAAVLLAVLSLFTPFQLHKGVLDVGDYIAAAGWGLLFIVILPVGIMILAKTQKRVLSIDSNGIQTRIGSQEGNIPWTAVASVTVTDEYVLITGKTANAFTIPRRAFANDEQRSSFARLASVYLASARRPATDK